MSPTPNGLTPCAVANGWTPQLLVNSPVNFEVLIMMMLYVSGCNVCNASTATKHASIGDKT